MDEDEKTYEIIRFYSPTSPQCLANGKYYNEVIKKGLTLEEAHDWCADDGTQCNDYFDGFQEE